jgi:hypothetical protein
LAPRLAKRAYELYEKRGRQGGLADQDWQQAVREIEKDDADTVSAADATTKASSNVTPQLIKRVHALYEELGREEVQAVEQLEKQTRETRKVVPHE